MRYYLVKKKAFTAKYHGMLLFIDPGCQYSPEEKIDEMKKFIVDIFMNIQQPYAFNIVFFTELVVVSFFWKNDQWFFIPDAIGEVNIYLWGTTNISIGIKQEYGVFCVEFYKMPCYLSQEYKGEHADLFQLKFSFCDSVGHERGKYFWNSFDK